MPYQKSATETFSFCGSIFALRLRVQSQTQTRITKSRYLIPFIELPAYTKNSTSQARTRTKNAKNVISVCSPSLFMFTLKQHLDHMLQGQHAAQVPMQQKARWK